MLSRLAGKGEHSGIFQTAGGCRKLKVTEFGQTERLSSLSWSAAAACLGGLGAAFYPPQACAWRVGGRRLGAEPAGAVCWHRERGGGACGGHPAAGTVPAQAPFLGLGLALSVRTKSSLETPSTAGKGLRLLWYTLGWSLVAST